MHPVIQELVSRGPILTDGAWGTELQARGLGPGEFPERWNLVYPERVREVAQAYVEAGSDIILTNTFGGNRIRAETDSVADRAREINRAGVQISKMAAGKRVLVFGSIGPTGKLLMDEEINSDEIRDAYVEQAGAMAEAGADGLVIETMSDLAEAQLALEAARETGLPVVVCMTFDSGSAKDRTMMGHTPEEIVAALAAAGADVLGANCGAGIGQLTAVCRRFRAVTPMPLWIKPNAGLPVIVNRRVTYEISPEDFAACVPELVEAGASFIGGCCGTNPDFIRSMKLTLNRAIPTQERNQ